MNWSINHKPLTDISTSFEGETRVSSPSTFCFRRKQPKKQKFTFTLLKMRKICERREIMLSKRDFPFIPLIFSTENFFLSIGKFLLFRLHLRNRVKGHFPSRVVAFEVNSHDLLTIECWHRASLIKIFFSFQMDPRYAKHEKRDDGNVWVFSSLSLVFIGRVQLCSVSGKRNSSVLYSLLSPTNSVF